MKLHIFAKFTWSMINGVVHWKSGTLVNSYIIRVPLHDEILDILFFTFSFTIGLS